MARMIPPLVHSQCSSAGEKELFNRLRDDPGTKDWIILHSLDVSNHVSQTAGELDFVIIVPRMGVLCVEVKGCRSYKYKEGLWYYGRDVNGDPRGPFKQAKNGMYSLRNYLSEKNPELNRVPFFSAVIFPYCSFTETSSEWHAWEVIDSRLLIANPISRSIINCMNKWREHLLNKGKVAGFYGNSREPYSDQCETIASTLRKDFESHEGGDLILSQVNKDLVKYTVEQFDALDFMAQNPRVLFKGPAGTGKTFLALEAARRASMQGKRVLLVCYNRLLQEWLTNRVSGKEIEVSTIHSLLLKISGARVEGTSSTFWDSELPEMALVRLLSDEEFIFPKFDILIIDEAQDIFSDTFLDVLDLVVHGGLAAGKWNIFGDFQGQNIYSKNKASAELLLSQRCGQVPEVSLNVNCRNTPRIGNWAESVGNLDPKYSRFRRDDNGVDPVVISYQKKEKQLNQLVDLLDRIVSQGYQLSDIVILSPYTYEGSVLASLVGKAWNEKIRPYSISLSNFVRFSTIHSFKGLESPIVIITDIDRASSFGELQLLYIALSRSVHNVHIMVQEDVKSSILNLILKNGVSNNG